jgi:DNA-binding transcriptional MerR regulator
MAQVNTRKPLPPVATTDDLVRITGLTKDTMYDWADMGLLPAPEVISDGRRGIKSRWPIEALERARFVMARRAELLTLAEIAALVAEKWGPPTAEDIARRNAARELRRPKRLRAQGQQ